VSGHRRECVHGTLADTLSGEEPLRDEFLQQTLHHLAVETKPDGMGDLIGGGATGFLPPFEGRLAIVPLRHLPRRGG